MIYFDNAATGGEKPAPVVTAVAAALRVCANPGRSGHALSVACAKNVLRTRETLAGLFDAPDPERVIFTQNCTEALNIFIFGTLKRGDHVITTPLEHNSVLRPLERLKTQGIIDYDVCPIENGNVTPEGIASLVRENTALVIVTAASNVTGKMPPLAEIRKALPERIFSSATARRARGTFLFPWKNTDSTACVSQGIKGFLPCREAAYCSFQNVLIPRLFATAAQAAKVFHFLCQIFTPTRWKRERFPTPRSFRFWKARDTTAGTKRKSPPPRFPSPPDF